MQLLAYLLALLSGAVTPAQNGVNATLKKMLGEPLQAVVINFAVGFLVALVYAAIRGVGWPDASKAAAAPWWAWIGGVGGAAIGVVAVFLADQLGAATLMALVIIGQIGCSVILDHFGILGYDQHALTPLRSLGVLLMAGGVVLVAKY